MRRREFITLLGGVAVAAWPVAARAQQQPDRKRSIGVLLPLVEDDPFARAEISAFVTALQQAGWVDGRNARIEIRWAGPVPSDIRRHAAGGNVTGFMNFEYSLAAKWLELLKEMIPTLSRVAVLRNASTPTGPAQFGIIQAVSSYLKLDVTPLNIRNVGDFEPAIAGFAKGPNDGLIVAASSLAQTHRKVLLGVIAQHMVPAIYALPQFVTDGGLMSYAPNEIDQFRQAAGYVDRILKGEKPGDLPVQSPAKYVLSINLKTAKALGIDVPPSLLARADEVIE